MALPEWHLLAHHVSALIILADQLPGQPPRKVFMHCSMLWSWYDEHSASRSSVCPFAGGRVSNNAPY